MSYVIQSLGHLWPVADRHAPSGWYLAFFDPEIDDGFGGATQWSPNLDEAIRYDTMQEAIRAYHIQSKTVPLRYDGKPNRPMTAYSIEIMEVS